MGKSFSSQKGDGVGCKEGSSEGREETLGASDAVGIAEGSLDALGATDTEGMDVEVGPDDTDGEVDLLGTSDG